MQASDYAFTNEDQAIFNMLDERARQRGRNVDHAEIYTIIKRLAANPRPVDLSGRTAS